MDQDGRKHDLTYCKSKCISHIDEIKFALRRLQISVNKDSKNTDIRLEKYDLNSREQSTYRDTIGALQRERGNVGDVCDNGGVLGCVGLGLNLRTLARLGRWNEASQSLTMITATISGDDNH